MILTHKDITTTITRIRKTAPVPTSVIKMKMKITKTMRMQTKMMRLQQQGDTVARRRMRRRITSFEEEALSIFLPLTNLSLRVPPTPVIFDLTHTFYNMHLFSYSNFHY